MPLFDATLSILEQSMNVRLDRQNLLASDLANANTPGFQAKDLDFDKAMHAAAQDLESSANALSQRYASQASSLSMAGSGSGSMEGQVGTLDPGAGHNSLSLSLPTPIVSSNLTQTESAGGSLGLDHNRVDTDHAMVALAANAINYGASAKAIAKKLAILSYVASDGQG